MTVVFVSVLPMAMSPAVTSVWELSSQALFPAATDSSPTASTAFWSKYCVTSPFAQMFWLTDWSTIVVRLSMWNLFAMVVISLITGGSGWGDGG